MRSLDAQYWVNKLLLGFHFETEICEQFVNPKLVVKDNRLMVIGGPVWDHFLHAMPGYIHEILPRHGNSPCKMDYLGTAPYSMMYVGCGLMLDGTILLCHPHPCSGGCAATSCYR